MAKSKYTTEQVITKLREVEHLCAQGKTVSESLKCVEITEKLYYRWREKYGWMAADEHKRMRELENENERLKELVRLWVKAVGEESPALGSREGASETRPYYG